MKIINNKIWMLAAALLLSVGFTSCSDDDDEMPEMPVNYAQEDQMGRPAINTVFVSSSMKDNFNTTAPSAQGAAYQAAFESRLLALNPNYSTNALGMDATTFTTALATDVLSVSLDGTTTFFDGTNVLTGRALADDVISVELLLIFGGPDGTANPGLSDDNVDANDKAFLSSFPYLATTW
jgi:hypothetical protein